MPAIPSFTKEDSLRLAATGWRSPVEFARIFLPGWFPTKMPWFHRGMAALRVGRADFLLDFGPEWWPFDVARGRPSEWTVADLLKIITNFVIEVTPAVLKDGAEVTPAVLEPMFILDFDPQARIIGCRIRDPKKRNAFMVPRGFSKTTLINALNLRDVVYGEESFILYTSETAGHATNQVSTVRNQLQENDLLIAVFGDRKPGRQESEKWTDGFIEVLGPEPEPGEPRGKCILAALGSGGQVRGISKDAQRPTRIVVDDFQSKESMASPTQIEKDLDWFIGTLLPAGEEFELLSLEMAVDVIGTLLGPDAILAQLMTDSSWNRVRFGAIDRQGQMLWEAKLSHEGLAAKRAEFERVGKLDSFDYEYMSQLPVTDGVQFPLDKIIYVNRPSEWFIAKSVVCDPAISTNPKADFCTLVAAGMGKFGDIHVIDFHAEVGMEFDAQAEKFFEFHFAHCLDLPFEQVHHGVEAVAYQRALVSLISSKQHEKSKTWGARAYFEVIPILHGRHEPSKIMRVQGFLSPRVRTGHFSMERPYQTLLGQLRDWGKKEAKKDGPDAVAMAVRLLDPTAATLAAVPDEEGEAVQVGSKLPKLVRVGGAP